MTFSKHNYRLFYGVESEEVLQCPLVLESYFSRDLEIWLGYINVDNSEHIQHLRHWVVTGCKISDKKYEALSVPKDIEEYRYDF